MTFSLRGRLGLDAREFEDGAQKASKAIGEVGDDLDVVGRKNPKPRIDADDRATAEVDNLERKLQGLEGNDRTVKLNAEASRLEAVVRDAERKLQKLDGEAARPTLDVRNRASAQLDEVKRQLEKEIPEAAEGGGQSAAKNLADGFGSLKGAAGAAIGGAIGTAIIAGLELGVSRMQIRAQFRAQFGLIEEDAERLGGQAADIYKGGWGESTAEVMQALGLVQQRLVETGRVGEDEAQRIAEGAIVIADTWGEDVPTVIEAVGKIMLNGLAPDAMSAMDMMVEALQNGGNAAGDLFESVDEYAQHFAAFGLSAEDMMALFIAGMQNGQRDTDKLADAVKEMRIRTVEDGDVISAAYVSLGLDADAYRAKILEGGPAAREAFGDIIEALRNVDDPVEQNRLAIEMMGTQYEDLGPTALDAFAQMEEGLGNVSGKLDEVNTQLTEAQPEWERLKRRGKEAFGEMAESGATFINDQIDGMQDLGEAIGGLFNPEGAKNRAAVEAFEEQEAAIVKLYDSMTLGAESFDDIRLKGIAMGAELHTINGVIVRYADEQAIAAGYTDAAAQRMAEADAKAGAYGDRMQALADDILEKSGADSHAERTAEEHEAAMAEQQEAADDLAQSIQDLIGSQADLVGGELAVERATMSAKDAIDKLTEAADESGTESDEYAAALNRAKQSQLDAAGAAARYQIDLREANGEALSAQDKNRILADELDKVAATLEPGSALQQAVVGYAEDLRGVPDKVATAIGLDDEMARADLLFYLGKLEEIPRTKETTVKTTYLASGVGYKAEGGPVEAGRTYWVGEEGPELVTFGHSGYVHTATESAQMSAGGGRPIAMPGPAISSGVLAGGAGGTEVQVRVMIGDREITDMVETVIMSHEAQKALVV